MAKSSTRRRALAMPRPGQRGLPGPHPGRWMPGPVSDTRATSGGRAVAADREGDPARRGRRRWRCGRSRIPRRRSGSGWPRPGRTGEATCRARWRASTMSSGSDRATVSSGHSMRSTFPHDHRRIVPAARVITIQHGGDQRRVQREQTCVTVRRPGGCQAVGKHHDDRAVMHRDSGRPASGRRCGPPCRCATPCGGCRRYR